MPGSVVTAECHREQNRWACAWRRTAVQEQPFDDSGLLTGNGQIVGDVINAGAIAPGNSADSLSIDGTLTLLADASVPFEIGGTQAGGTPDFINVTESAPPARWTYG